MSSVCSFLLLEIVFTLCVHTRSVHLWSLSWWTKHVSIIELFKIPKITIQKSHSLPVEGTRIELTSRLANKIKSHHTIVKRIRNITRMFIRLSTLELCCDASDGQVCRQTGVQTDRCADRQANSCLFSAAASVLTPFFCAALTHIITSFLCDFCFNAVRNTT